MRFFSATQNKHFSAQVGFPRSAFFLFLTENTPNAYVPEACVSGDSGRWRGAPTRPRINGLPQQRGWRASAIPIPERHRGTRPDPNFKAQKARRKAQRSRDRAESLTWQQRTQRGHSGRGRGLTPAPLTPLGPRVGSRDAATPWKTRWPLLRPSPHRALARPPARSPQWQPKGARRAARGRRLGARANRLGVWDPRLRRALTFLPLRRGVPFPWRCRSGAAWPGAGGQTDRLTDGPTGCRSAPRLAAGGASRYSGNGARRRCARSEGTGRGQASRKRRQDGVYGSREAADPQSGEGARGEAVAVAGPGVGRVVGVASARPPARPPSLGPGAAPGALEQPGLGLRKAGQCARSASRWHSHAETRREGIFASPRAVPRAGAA